jgi:hypothetical protein
MSTLICLTNPGRLPPNIGRSEKRENGESVRGLFGGVTCSKLSAFRLSLNGLDPWICGDNLEAEMVGMLAGTAPVEAAIFGTKRTGRII